jgi:hypothetical protein
MRKSQRFAFLAIGGLGLLAAIAPGLAAGIATPEGASVPAAGQGIVDVQGFDVTAIDWTVEADGEVDQVTFTITRSENGATAVTAAADESSGDAVVRIRLELDPVGSLPKDWVSCAVTTGSATCDTSASGATMAASDLSRVNIIAFDRN